MSPLAGNVQRRHAVLHNTDNDNDLSCKRPFTAVEISVVESLQHPYWTKCPSIHHWNILKRHHFQYLLTIIGLCLGHCKGFNESGPSGALKLLKLKKLLTTAVEQKMLSELVLLGLKGEHFVTLTLTKLVQETFANSFHIFKILSITFCCLC